jgi:hypothetical protein
MTGSEENEQGANDRERHRRTMNLNAHFAWGFGFWASADSARMDGNLMLAPIGYYYAAFHTAYAYLNAVPGIEPATFTRIGHQQLSNLIDRNLGHEFRDDFDKMRDLREAINYLGFGEPASKLRVLRGHSLIFGDDQQSFDMMVCFARDRSRAFIIKTLDRLAALPIRSVDTFPKRGDADENWMQEYMQEDLYRGTMSEAMRGRTLLIVRNLLA